MGNFIKYNDTSMNSNSTERYGIMATTLKIYLETSVWNFALPLKR